jgi:hypothetical protein
MIDDALVLRIERLRDEVEGLRDEIRARYHGPGSLVVFAQICDTAAQIGERWLVEIASRDDVGQVIGQDIVGKLNVEFQRLITFSEQATQRRRYEATIKAILTGFRTQVVVPMKQSRNRVLTRPTPRKAIATNGSLGIIFIGQSFAPDDAAINSAIGRFVEAYGFKIVTGEKPSADSVSKKVRKRIEGATFFLGIFTRRDRLKRRAEWTTSSWVIDEKAYALAKRKKLILLRETGVQSIGGIQGDYEYIEFSRGDLTDPLIKLLQILRGLRT